MSRAPRISGKECIAALAKAGFEIERIKGSHHVLRHADGRRAVVPVHGSETLGPGLLRNILVSAGISVEGLIELLGE